MDQKRSDIHILEELSLFLVGMLIAFLLIDALIGVFWLAEVGGVAGRASLAIVFTAVAVAAGVANLTHQMIKWRLMQLQGRRPAAQSTKPT